MAHFAPHPFTAGAEDAAIIVAMIELLHTLMAECFGRLFPYLAT